MWHSDKPTAREYDFECPAFDQLRKEPGCQLRCADFNCTNGLVALAKIRGGKASAHLALSECPPLDGVWVTVKAGHDEIASALPAADRCSQLCEHRYARASVVRRMSTHQELCAAPSTGDRVVVSNGHLHATNIVVDVRRSACVGHTREFKAGFLQLPCDAQKPQGVDHNQAVLLKSSVRAPPSAFAAAPLREPPRGAAGSSSGGAGPHLTVFVTRMDMGNLAHLMADLFGVAELFDVLRPPSATIVMLDVRLMCFRRNTLAKERAAAARAARSLPRPTKKRPAGAGTAPDAEGCLPDCFGPFKDLWRAVSGAADAEVIGLQDWAASANATTGVASANATGVGGAVAVREAVFVTFGSRAIHHIWASYGSRMTPCRSSDVLSRFQDAVVGFYRRRRTPGFLPPPPLATRKLFILWNHRLVLTTGHDAKTQQQERVLLNEDEVLAALRRAYVLEPPAGASAAGASASSDRSHVSSHGSSHGSSNSAADAFPLPAAAAAPPPEDRYRHLRGSARLRVVDFGRLPLSQQIGLTHRCDLFTGMHGAGFAHALWMRPRTAVVELLPIGWGPAMYGNLARLLGVSFYPWLNIYPHRQRKPDGSLHTRGNMTIRWETLKPTLDVALDRAARGVLKEDNYDVVDFAELRERMRRSLEHVEAPRSCQPWPGCQQRPTGGDQLQAPLSSETAAAGGGPASRAAKLNEWRAAKMLARPVKTARATHKQLQLQRAASGREVAS